MRVKPLQQSTHRDERLLWRAVAEIEQRALCRDTLNTRSKGITGGEP
jgi:hypothetical protein